MSTPSTLRAAIAKLSLTSEPSMIKGAVPGSKGGWVTVKDAVKKPLPENVPFPAALRSAEAPAVAEEAPAEGGEA